MASVWGELKRRNVVRVAIAYAIVAWLLIEVSATTFPILNLPEWAVTLVTVLLLIGFPVALILAWAFELTPEGLRKEKDVDRSQSITRQTGRKLDFVIIAVLAIGMSYLTFDKFMLDPSRDAELVQATTQAVVMEQSAAAEVSTEPDQSIVVLPFVNMSDDASNEYFSDGLSEELMNLLSRIQGLRVIARTSSFSYKGKDVKIEDVARDLNVGYALEGSVRKADNQVRITVQLIQSTDSTQLWSQTYDRTLDNIFAIQDEIAASVVDQLKVRLLDATPLVVRTDPEAYTLYLRARYLVSQNSIEQLEQATPLLKQALTIDPGYAAAWSELGRAYANQASAGLIPADTGFDLARDSKKRALANDPDHAPTLSRLGWMAMRDRNLSESAKFMQQALKAEPRSLVVLSNSSQLLTTLGHYEEAIALIKYAVSIDPINPLQISNLSEALYLDGQFDEAIKKARVVQELSPGYLGSRYKMGRALLLQGEYEAALASMIQEVSEGFRFKGIALAAHDLGQQAEFETTFDQFREDWGERWPSDVAAIYARIGEADKAFEWLEKAAEEEDSRLFFHVHDPLMANIHSDPRWLPFLEHIGMSPDQLAAIEFNVTVPE